jgi:RNA polymerase sigma-70 factor (ECF subfamily)
MRSLRIVERADKISPARPNRGARAGVGEDMRGRKERTEALAELFAAHAARLAGALAAAGYADATDAVQEAFVQAVVHWRKVGEYDDPLLWIRRVAINRALNRRRSRHRQRVLAERLAAQPTGAVHAPETHDDLTDAITALPQQQRLVVALYYFADLPIADIAHVMDVSEGTVKSHLHAARASLAVTMETSNDV